MSVSNAAAAAAAAPPAAAAAAPPPRRAPAAVLGQGHRSGDDLNRKVSSKKSDIK